MTVYFVSRHAGAREWAGRHAPEAVLKRHLDAGDVAGGDVVLGTLPVPLAAAVTARGARYVHLVFEVAEDERGAELSADALEARGARLVEFRVAGVGGDNRQMDRSTKQPWEEKKS
jgi:CRISPR-associated protein Csx16